MHKSISTIASPQFINLQPLDLNPLMESCEIKVLYVGENRNHSFISKQTAVEMSKTLRGCPIVGYYSEEKEDFRDHGDQITVDGDGVHFNCLTKPYGFVAPDAKVWFQTFEDQDDFGNKVEREYLMTTGYLWTGQFEECKVAIKQGRPHSMQLDGNTIDGKWSTNSKTGIEFFIINDATFSKLCILGDDVEPCFEGSSVTAPNVSTSFTMDDGFRKTLYSMMQDLKNFAYRGGQQMDNQELDLQEPVIEESAETDFAKKEKEEAGAAHEPPAQEEDAPAEDAPAADDEEKEKKKKNAEPDTEHAQKKKCGNKCELEDEESTIDNEQDELQIKFDSLEKNYNELETRYNELNDKYTALENENKELNQFKASIEDAKKDDLINSFYMLSDEDKQDVIDNKSTYSYDDIEAKLSILCVRKKVSFNDENKTEQNLVFNLDSDVDNAPAWIKALRSNRKVNQ